MTKTIRIVAFAALASLPVMAQSPVRASRTVSAASVASTSDTAKVSDSVATTPKKAPPAPRYIVPPQEMQYMRHSDQRGVNVFESTKEAGADYTGFKINWGGAFAQQFQNLTHQNTAAPKLVTGGADANSLIQIGSGFNNADANLFLN